MRRTASKTATLLLAIGLAGSVILTANARPGNGHGPHETGPPAHANGPIEDRARGVTHVDLEPGEQGCSSGYGFKSRRLQELCTHGADVAPGWVADVRTADTDPVDQATAEAAATDVVCDGDGVSGNRVQALYVRPSDEPDRFAEYVDSIRAWAIDVQEHYRNSSNVTGGDLAMRFVHSPTAPDGTCVIDVQHVVIGANDDASFNNTINAVQAQGHDDGTRNYAMWVEANTYCGIGTLYNDDRSSPASNYNNLDIASYSRVDRGCWSWAVAMTHELSHNVGAVQNSSPHSSGGFHCNDNNDIMCYSDGGSTSNLYTDPNCSDSAYNELLDCNNDDYFHTNPPANNYLATHWNTANSKWLFVPTAPPPNDTTPPTLTVTSPASGSWAGGSVQPVAGTVGDDSGLDHVDRIEISLGSAATIVYPGGNANWSTTLDLSGEPDGSATLTAIAHDTSGNASAPLVVAVTVDSTPPAFAVTSPSSGASLAGTVAVTVDGSDVGAGVTDVTVRLEGDQIVEVAATADGGNWVASVPTGSLADGPAWLSAHGHDGVGHVGSDDGFAVTIDNVVEDSTPPTLTVTAPASGTIVTTDTLVVTGTLNDDVAVGQVQVGWAGDSPVTTTPAGDGTWTVNLPVTVANGPATVEVVGFDAAGNNDADSVPVDVNRDLAPPTVAIGQPTDNEIVSGDVTVSGTVSDDQGVDRVDVVFGGVTRAALVNGDGTWTTTIDTTAVGDGPAFVDAYAYDTAGKQGADSVEVEVDNVAEPVTETFTGKLTRKDRTASFDFSTLAGEVVLTVDDGSTASANARPDGNGRGGNGGKTPPTWVLDVYDHVGNHVGTTSGPSPATLTLDLAGGDYMAVVSGGRRDFTLTVSHW